MIDGLKPYPKYKDSGLPWLGEVPEHWEVLQIGRVGSLFKGNGGNKGDEVPVGVPCVRYGDLYTRYEFFIRSTKAHVSKERAADYTSIRYGDILFAASGETIEDIGRSAVNLIETDACCGGDVLVLRPRIDAVSEFLGYASDSAASQHQKACMGRGFTVVHIYGSQLKRLAFPFPPLPEQTAIVRFLDWADQRIQRVIRARERRIKLLEEYKQALIHQAVTGQIDVRTGKPYPKYKGSGVEWLGNVPEHWEMRKLRALFTKTGSGTTPSGEEFYGGDIPWVVTGDLNDSVLSSTTRTVSAQALETLSALRLYPKYSLIIAMYGATIGRTAILDMEACTNQACCVLAEPHEGMLVRFIQSVIISAKEYIVRQGYGGGQPNINSEIVHNLRIPAPPSEEQTAIVKFLDKQTEKIDTTIAADQRVIDLLKEFRTRLIADVVTGKLDVRGYNMVKEGDATPQGG